MRNFEKVKMGGGSAKVTRRRGGRYGKMMGETCDGSGAGGGSEQAGKAKEKKNSFPRDIRREDPESVPSHHILTAGFPCQPFSRLGSQPGLADRQDRGNLFLYIVKILRLKKPPMFLLENVPGLLSTRSGSYSSHEQKSALTLSHCVMGHIKARTQ